MFPLGLSALRLDPHGRPRPAATGFGPDFVVAGAAKAGTTALWHWLRSHPEVFLPASVKEPGHFAFRDRSAAPSAGPFDPCYVARIATSPEDYASLYEDAGSRRRGDVSPVYLTDPGVPARLAARRPDARVIILLRDPVTRAFSQYLHHRRDALEHLDFEAALRAEPERRARGWSWGHAYAANGHYLPQVQAWLDDFGAEQVLFLTHEDLRARPDAVWDRICDHLGIARAPLAENRQVNATCDLAHVSGRPWLERRLRHPGAVQSGLKRLLPPTLRQRLRTVVQRPQPVPRLLPATRDRLAAAYLPERAELARLTGLDLSGWIVPEPPGR